MEALLTLARVYVDDLDKALPTMRQLTGQEPGARFSFQGVEIASIGGFLLVAGSEEARAPFGGVQSTVLVDDLDGVFELLEAFGGEVLSGPNPVPTGRNLTARHPGGVVIEYVEHCAPE